MALVMLPCELPWWSSLQRHLKHLLLASSTQKLVDGMLKIHEMCNISIDPDEDEKVPNLMKGFEDYLDNDLSPAERTHFMDHTLPSIIHRALQLKHWKPPSGLNFSLQQQPDLTELSYDFVSSLLAHAFFSTYPKRTLKTHPTLQDFNFTHFFTNLHRPYQKAKLKSLLHYFDWLEKNNNEGTVKISRQVMNSKQWLTIEDWLECSLPLSRIQIKHEGRIERCSTDGMEVCFSTSRLGGEVLGKSCSQESIAMCTMPEMLMIMLSVEALEDNEVIRIEGIRRFSKILEPKQKWRLEVIDNPEKVSICCMDPENYTILPLGQYEDDNILRELNKCLLGFQQKPMKPPEVHVRNPDKRLSPIGESFSHTPPEVEATVFIKQLSASTINSFSSRSPSPDAYCAATINLNDPSVEISKKKCYLSPEMNTLNNRRGRFIVLGSSGECLPVKRPVVESCDSLYSSCNSSFDEYHSANTSVDEADSDDEGQQAARQYSLELNTIERRESFAQRLRDALKREMENSITDSMSTDSSYAVGISIAGSGLQDGDIRLKRGGSGGFVLREDSLDEEFLKESLAQEQQWISKFRSRQSPGLVRRDTNDSYSTEYSSELEEVYEQFSQWLDDPIMETDTTRRKGRELDTRDLAVVRFASSLLKRTLSESFAGVPLTDGCIGCTGMDSRSHNKKKLVMSVRSLSLELARHKHKLAAQLSLQCPNISNGNEDEKVTLSVKQNSPVKKKHPKLIKEKSVTKEHENNCSNGVDTNSLQVISRRSSKKSRTSSQGSVDKKVQRKTKLNWVIDCITEAIEQTIECEPITMKIQKSQLSQLANKTTNGSFIKPIITGNWGCGSSKSADPQLKLIIQWLASSVAGAPTLIYYTSGKSQLFKLDTLIRVLVDRKWTVGQLTTATLKFSHQTLHEPQVIPENNTLFDELIGIDKCNNGA